VTSGPTRREVALAGHAGDVDTARRALDADEPAIRATALGALQRLGELTDEVLAAAFEDASGTVRRRAAEIAAAHAGIDLMSLLHDTDPAVVEMAAWASGEHESSRGEIVERLVDLAGGADDPLVREAAVAALGAIGSEGGRAAILHALSDKPAIRRRAVLALAPFDGPDVDAAIERSLEDRDWQVRQAAEDLRRAMR
jgi:HEAT repeat protein